MLRLKATKTSLYKLVLDFEPLPPMAACESRGGQKGGLGCAETV